MVVIKILDARRYNLNLGRKNQLFKKHDRQSKGKLKSNGNKISTQIVFSLVPKYLTFQPFTI